MPRYAAPSPHLLARVRTHFGLSQAELAQWLGVAGVTVQHIESGRRGLTGAVLAPLLPLLPHLPPAAAAADPTLAPADAPAAAPAPPAAPLPPGTAAPDPRPLDLRRRTCLARAARLRHELAGLAARATAAHHWALALPALLAHPALATAAAAAAENPAEDPAEAAFQAERTAWRRNWAARRARPLPPAEATRWGLLRARVVALEAEAAALAPEGMGVAGGGHPPNF